MKRILLLLACLALSACTTLGNITSTAPTGVSSGVMTNINGMTLYTFAVDPPNKSTCNDDCARAWPPLIVFENDRKGGDYTIVTRSDGRKQWAYKGKPLYLSIKDKKPGDQNGAGVGGVWQVARP
ncbi:MAG: hypothetical protein EPO06_04800 [Burkholderiaceae bacterium]|nr:MAG: hypothetical protein EPO06_04800 [Burkholderiaceae bacterium]